jgi:hypothetical protein
MSHSRHDAWAALAAADGRRVGRPGQPRARRARQELAVHVGGAMVSLTGTYHNLLRQWAEP